MAKQLAVIINGKEYVSAASQQAQKSVTKLGKVVETVNKVALASFVGAVAATSAAVAGLAISVKKAAEAGDRIDKMSQQIGLTRQSFQEWDYVLTQTGTEIEGLKTGVKTLFTALEQAERGSDKYASTLERLNVSIRDGNGEFRDREAIFTDVMMGLAGVNNETERSILANNLLGRAAQQLQPLFNAGAESIAQMKDQARELGLIMSGDAIDAAVKWTDAMDRIKRTFNNFRNEAMTPFMTLFADVSDRILPALNKMLTDLSTAIKEFGKSKGFTDLETSMSVMIVDAITFAEHFPRILLAGIEDVKVAWDDLWSGKKMTEKMTTISDNLINLMQATTNMVGGVIFNGFNLIATMMGEALVRVVNELVRWAESIVKFVVDPLISLVNLVKKNDIKPVSFGRIEEVAFSDIFDDFAKKMDVVFSQSSNALQNVTDEQVFATDNLNAAMDDYRAKLDENIRALGENTEATKASGGSGGTTSTGAPTASYQYVPGAHTTSPAMDIVVGMNKAMGSIFGFITNLGSKFGETISSLSSFQAIVDPITTIVAGIMEEIQPILDEILPPIVGILKIIGRTIGAVLAPNLKMLSSVVTWLSEAFVWLYNKAIVPAGNMLYKAFAWVANGIIWVVNGIIKLINKIPGVNINRLSSIDTSTDALSAIDMGSLYEAGGAADSSSYTGGSTGSSTSVQSVNINIYQTFDGPVIGEGGLESVGEFVVKAIQAYSGVGGNVQVVTA